MEQEIGPEKPPRVPSDPIYSMILCSSGKRLKYFKDAMGFSGILSYTNSK